MSYRLLTLGIVYSATLLGEPSPAAVEVVGQLSTRTRPNYFTPLCDLESLNHEYAAALTYRRCQASSLAPVVCFDRNMLPGVVFHNQRMVEHDSLFHDYLSFHAELVGYLAEPEGFRNTPQKLARYIWTRFDRSPLHAAIQRNPSLCYVSVSCSEHYFVVRLDDHPSPRDRAELYRFRRWQAHSLTVVH